MFIVSGSSCREEQFRMDDRERERENKKKYHMETCICNSLGRSEPRMASLDLSGEYTPSRKILHGQCAFFQDDQRSGGD